MTKQFTLLLLALAGTLQVNASIKTIYQQDYEQATDASAWTSPNASANLKLVTGDAVYGKYISFAPNSNDRSAQTLFYTTSDFYGDATSYTLEFDAAIKSGNNHRTTELCVMSDGGTIKNNNSYIANNGNANFLFDLSNTTDATTYYVNGDASNTLQLPQSEWLHFKLDVDGTAGTVTYTVTKTADGSTLTSGTYMLPQGTSYKAKGVFFNGGRYFPTLSFDNVNIYQQLAYDVANPPKVALTAVMGTGRQYTLSYGDQETLHYTLPGEQEFTATGGEPVTVTTHQAGVLEAYTTSGTATSDTVRTQVSADSVRLATPACRVSSIGQLYYKQYTVHSDNTQVPLNPTATLSYVFTPANGGDAISGTVANDSAITVNESGVLRITVSANGYAPADTLINNETSYKQMFDYNFATMTRQQLVANSYLDVGEAFNDSRWSQTNALNFVVMTDNDEAASQAFPGLTLFTNKVPTIIVGLGLMAPLKDADGVTVSTYGTPLTITNGKADEYAVITTSNNYGASTATEVMQADERYSLYRFSTVLTDIKLFVPEAVANAINHVPAEQTSGTDRWYNLQGVCLHGQPALKGIYLHNGKKVVVR